MRALVYIITKSIKNSVLEIAKTPSKLFLYLMLVACFCMQFARQFDPQNSAISSNQIDIIWLKCMYLLIAAYFTITAVHKGLSNGDVIFEMNDVNFLFVAPISSKAILFYGLLQMLRTAFGVAFLIFFAGNYVSSLFGKGFDTLAILFFSLVFIILLLSIVSLVVYSKTNGDYRKKNIAKGITVALFLPVVLVFIMQFVKNPQPLLAIENTLRSPILDFAPIFGWSTASAMGFVNGSASTGFIFLGIILATIVALFIYVLNTNIDYYEDVLVATETNFDKKLSIAQSGGNSDAAISGKTKVTKTGIKGNGASAFFHKHYRETMRANKFGALSITSICIIIGAGIVTYFTGDEFGGCLPLLPMLAWIQVFLIGTGSGMKELSNHYIYLVPESSFNKIIFSNLEAMLTILLEATLLFIVIGIVGKDSPIIIIGCILAYVSFSAMLIGVNYLSMRIFGTEMGSGLLVMLYMFAVIILILPGLIGGIMLATFMGTTALASFVGLLAIAVWAIVVAIGCTALSKGILHNCDMLKIPIKK